MRSLRSLRRLPGARARSTSASSPAPSAAIADVLQAGPSVDVDEPKCRHELERASLLGDHAALRAEVDASIARHKQAESDALARIAAPRDG